MYNPETAELSQRIGGEGGGGGGTELASPAYTPPSFTSLPQDDPGSLSPSALALREPLVIVLIVVSGITLLMGGLVMASCFWETYKTERRLREQEGRLKSSPLDFFFFFFFSFLSRSMVMAMMVDDS